MIALDGDGVLLDYSLAYASAWHKATGIYPAELDPKAYWPMDRWGVERLTGENLARFRTCFDDAFWRSIPPMENAVLACNLLHDEGYELICVTAIGEHIVPARLKNLRDHGFPIEKVIATPGASVDHSPKAKVLNQLQPEVFVDDYLPYMRGVHPHIQKALILREPNGSPNAGAELAFISSIHLNLAEFVEWWLVQTNPL